MRAPCSRPRPTSPPIRQPSVRPQWRRKRARARYDSGLATITEVADATRVLAQAEADDAIARLGVWRALLAVAQVHGDLTPFINRLITP